MSAFREKKERKKDQKPSEHHLPSSPLSPLPPRPTPSISKWLPRISSNVPTSPPTSSSLPSPPPSKPPHLSSSSKPRPPQTTTPPPPPPQAITFATKPATRTSLTRHKAITFPPSTSLLAPTQPPAPNPTHSTTSSTAPNPAASLMSITTSPPSKPSLAPTGVPSSTLALARRLGLMDPVSGPRKNGSCLKFRVMILSVLLKATLISSGLKGLASNFLK